jgi:hypothetical protein
MKDFTYHALVRDSRRDISLIEFREFPFMDILYNDGQRVRYKIKPIYRFDWKDYPIPLEGVG